MIETAQVQTRQNTLLQINFWQMMDMTLYDLAKWAKEELKERMNDVLRWEEYDESDHIHEIADSRVPIYYHQLLKVASSEVWLATEEPECWPAFDWSPTPINIIAANIYEHLVEKLREHVQEKKEEGLTKTVDEVD